MIEIRFHGRGGMGAVTATIILAKATGFDGKYAQAMPAFGPERRGAPVKSFCRISDKPITLRSHVYEPDHVVVLDPGLMGLPEVFEGVKKDTVLIVNSDKEMKFKQNIETHFFDATGLAKEIIGKPIVNTAMAAAFAKLSGLVSLNSLLKATEEVFGGKVLEMNKKVIQKAYETAR